MLRDSIPAPYPHKACALTRLAGVQDAHIRRRSRVDRTQYRSAARDREARRPDAPISAPRLEIVRRARHERAYAPTASCRTETRASSGVGRRDSTASLTDA